MKLRDPACDCTGVVTSPNSTCEGLTKCAVMVTGGNIDAPLYASILSELDI